MTLTLPVTVYCDRCMATAKVTAELHVGLFGDTTTTVDALPPGWSRFASRVGCPDHPADVLFATPSSARGEGEG